jgi:hypothetical protein
VVVIIKKGEIVEASFNPRSILMKTTCINAKREELQSYLKHQVSKAAYAFLIKLHFQDNHWQDC